MFVHENQEHRLFLFWFQSVLPLAVYFHNSEKSSCCLFSLSFLTCSLCSLFPLAQFFFLSYLFCAPANFDFFFLVWYKMMYTLRLRCHLGWWQVVQPLLLEKVTHSLYIVVYLAFHCPVSAVFRLKRLKIVLFICSHFYGITYFTACLCWTKFKGQGLHACVYRNFFTFYFLFSVFMRVWFFKRQ